MEMALDLRTVIRFSSDAYSTFIIGDKRCSLLRVTESSEDGAAFPSGSGVVDVEGSVFGFSYRTAYFRDTTADAVQGTVDGIIICVSKVMPSASDGDGAWARVIRCIRMNFEDHVEAGVAGVMIRM